VLQNQNRIGFGPVRNNRAITSVLIALIAQENFPNVYLRSVVCLLGVACVVRCMTTGIRYREGQLVVENIFRRATVKIEDVASIRFESRLSAAKRLIIQDGTGRRVAATGVSIWSFPILLPWQRPEKRLVQLQHFLARANVLEPYRAP
jgi:hypothetical protein